jgi:hypothetical protein
MHAHVSINVNICKRRLQGQQGIYKSGLFFACFVSKHCLIYPNDLANPSVAKLCRRKMYLDR